MSLSLRKMSGILMEIYCCLPKPYLLLTCHNVASAFFGRLESVEVIPPGTALRGFGKGGAIPLVSQKGTPGLNPAGPALAKPRGHQGTLGLRGTWLVLPALGVRHGPGAASARPGKGSS